MEISWYMCNGLRRQNISNMDLHVGAKLMDVIIRAEIVEVREAEFLRHEGAS